MKIPPITKQDIKTFQSDGVVVIRGLFKRHIDTLRSGVERNISEPGPYAGESTKGYESGRFFNDYCNWTRIPEFEEVIKDPSIAEVAAEIMQSNTVQVFHDHVLVKEPGTSKPTPWHQDAPYYFVDGSQTVSFWVPLDPVCDATLRCVSGSHRWEKHVLPTRWVTEESFYAHQENYIPIPDPDLEKMDIREWNMEPGDAVAFNFNTLHGARGNNTTTRRRAFSLGPVDKEDSQLARFMIQDCFLRSSYGSWRFDGRGMGDYRVLVAA